VCVCWTVAGQTNDLLRFSTTALQWEHLDAALVSGSPPSPRSWFGMTAVGNDIFVFGGDTDSGEEGRCAAGHRLGHMESQLVHRECLEDSIVMGLEA
jgi:hypothetical protein